MTSQPILPAAGVGWLRSERGAAESPAGSVWQSPGLGMQTRCEALQFCLRPHPWTDPGPGDASALDLFPVPGLLHRVPCHGFHRGQSAEGNATRPILISHGPPPALWAPAAPFDGAPRGILAGRGRAVLWLWGAEEPPCPARHPRVMPRLCRFQGHPGSQHTGIKPGPFKWTV